MKSETLRNIRTLRQIKTSGDIWNERCPKTTNRNTRTEKEIKYLESLEDPYTKQILEAERQRLKAYKHAISKSQERILKVREKLARIINRNRAITQLRKNIQQSFWEDDPPSFSKEDSQNASNFKKQIELKY
jgi:hypothetical protein